MITKEMALQMKTSRDQHWEQGCQIIASGERVFNYATKDGTARKHWTKEDAPGAMGRTAVVRLNHVEKRKRGLPELAEMG